MKKVSRDVEQMSLVATWVVVALVLFISSACGLGMAVRIFVWVSGL